MRVNLMQCVTTETIQSHRAVFLAIAVLIHNILAGTPTCARKLDVLQPLKCYILISIAAPNSLRTLLTPTASTPLYLPSIITLLATARPSHNPAVRTILPTTTPPAPYNPSIFTLLTTSTSTHNPAILPVLRRRRGAILRTGNGTYDIWGFESRTATD